MKQISKGNLTLIFLVLLIIGTFSYCSQYAKAVKVGCFYEICKKGRYKESIVCLKDVQDGKPNECHLNYVANGEKNEICGPCEDGQWLRFTNADGME